MKRTCIKVNAMSQAQLILHMFDGDHTCAELAELTGLHVLTVYQYCRELHKAGAAHICRYEPDVRGRHIIKVYKLGIAKDAKRVRMTGAQRQARTRAKKVNRELSHVLAGTAGFTAKANGRKKFEMIGVAP